MDVLNLEGNMKMVTYNTTLDHAGLSVKIPPWMHKLPLIVGLLAFAPMKTTAGELITHKMIFNPTPIAEQHFQLTGGLLFEFKPTHKYPMLFTPNNLRITFCYAGGGCGAAAGGGGG